MADTIQFKRGAAASAPKLAEGEPGWCRDTKELFIGTLAGNEKIADATIFDTVEQHEQMIARHGNTLTEQDEKLAEHDRELSQIQEDKLSANAASSVSALGADAELAAVVEKINALLAAMKTAGLMES